MDRNRLGPLPGPGFKQQVAGVLGFNIQEVISGEITATQSGRPLGSPAVAGFIADAWLSLGAGGADAVNPLSAELNIYKNGTTIFSTQPKITYVSGTSAQKTTKASGTGITQGVLSVTSLVAGDVFTYDLTIVRTASPTTEMANAVVVLEIEPY